jgi:hypothetical protein
MTTISTWLVASCSIEAEKAKFIETQIVDKYRITSVEGLQEILNVMPEMLETLTLPLLTAKYLRMKIGSFKCKQLETLLVREVQLILNHMFPDGEYADSFMNKKINGFVLAMVNTAEKLTHWGMIEAAHA